MSFNSSGEQKSANDAKNHQDKILVEETYDQLCPPQCKCSSPGSPVDRIEDRTCLRSPPRQHFVFVVERGVVRWPVGGGRHFGPWRSGSFGAPFLAFLHLDLDHRFSRRAKTGNKYSGLLKFFIKKNKDFYRKNIYVVEAALLSVESFVELIDKIGHSSAESIVLSIRKAALAPGAEKLV